MDSNPPPRSDPIDFVRSRSAWVFRGYSVGGVSPSPLSLPEKNEKRQKGRPPLTASAQPKRTNTRWGYAYRLRAPRARAARLVIALNTRTERGIFVWRSRLHSRNSISHLDSDSVAALSVKIAVVRHAQRLAVLEGHRYQTRGSRLRDAGQDKRGTSGSRRRHAITVGYASTVERE